MVLQEGRRCRVESLAYALSSLPEEKLQQLGDFTAVLQQVFRNL
ncbi:MAG: hypothetical protein ACHQLQ_01245 [Candidatus Acidiferrales bacterium]